MTFVNRLKGYRLLYSSSARKFIDRLDKKTALKITEKLDELIKGNSNLDVKKLAGSVEARYRLRIGDFRVIYALWEDQIVVYVVEIGHRREIYRD